MSILMLPNRNVAFDLNPEPTHTQAPKFFNLMKPPAFDLRKLTQLCEIMALLIPNELDLIIKMHNSSPKWLWFLEIFQPVSTYIGLILQEMISKQGMIVNDMYTRLLVEDEFEPSPMV
jgi:hypothetical protein